MIRRIVITSLLLVAALTASAQRSPIRVEWGIMGGVNVPEFTTNMSKTEIRNKLGWQAGITTAVNLGAFAIEGGHHRHRAADSLCPPGDAHPHRRRG